MTKRATPPNRGTGLRPAQTRDAQKRALRGAQKRALRARARGKRSQSRLGSEAAVMDLDALVAPASRTWRFDVSKLFSVLLLFGTIYILYLFLDSSRFQVHHVHIQGTRLLDKAEIEAAIDIKGASIFAIRTDELVRSLDQHFAGLARVSASCQLPNQVTITVREEQAVVAWESGGQTWWVDADGTVLGKARTTDASPGSQDPQLADLLVIRDVTGIAPQPQELLVEVPWRLALELRQVLPAITRFDYTRETGLVLYVTDGRWPVYLGHEGVAATKIAILESLVARLDREGLSVEHIDLRDEKAPTVKPR
jgi:cell division septal protein FtsQ